MSRSKLEPLLPDLTKASWAAENAVPAAVEEMEKNPGACHNAESAIDNFRYVINQIEAAMQGVKRKEPLAAAL